MSTLAMFKTQKPASNTYFSIFFTISNFSVSKACLVNSLTVDITIDRYLRLS